MSHNSHHNHPLHTACPRSQVYILYKYHWNTLLHYRMSHNSHHNHHPHIPCYHNLGYNHSRSNTYRTFLHNYKNYQDNACNCRSIRTNPWKTMWNHSYNKLGSRCHMSLVNRCNRAEYSLGISRFHISYHSIGLDNPGCI